MPLVNYCKHCRTEVPLGESCPHCGGKLTSTGEQTSFGILHTPVKDWFCWNSFLRIGVSLLILAGAVGFLSEALSGGSASVVRLIEDGFLTSLLVFFLILLAVVFLILLFQGKDRIHYLADRNGMQMRVYLEDPSRIQLLLRGTTPEAIRRLAESDDRPGLPGFTLVRKVSVSWPGVSKVHIWRETSAFLLYSPSFWLKLAVHCPLADSEVFEMFLRKKLKRNKKTHIDPSPQKSKTGKK